MVNMPLKCPHCESHDVGKFGASAVGKQRHICRNKGCRRCCKLYDVSNPAMIQIVKGERKRLKMIDKLFREIAAPPERPPYAVVQAAVATLDPLRVSLAA